MKQHILFLYISGLFFFLLLSVPVLGQDSLSLQQGSFYTYPSKFAIRLVYQERKLPLILEPLAGESRAVYQPNSARTLGIGGSVLGISYTLSFQLPSLFQRDTSRFGNTQQRDLRFNAFYKRLGLQLDRQDYTGYYLSNIQELDPDWQQRSGFPYRQDLRVRRYGLGISYLFKPQRFSYSAALNNRKKQFRSGGTFVLQAYGGRLRISADERILPQRLFMEAGEAGLVEEANIYHVSLMPGYAHTFVLGRFYLMTSLTIGPELQRRSLLRESSSGREEQWSVEGRLLMQTAFGYDDHRYFWNIAYISQRQQYEVEGLGINVNTNGFRLQMGRRFREFGFIRSIRQWDFYKKLKGRD